jgi:transcription initiation factor IIE alpha subunit
MTSPEKHQVHLAAIVQYLKKIGQCMDAEIAKATNISVSEVGACIPELVAQGTISSCSVIRFEGDKEIKGTLCRISGYIPPSSPGRKAGASS